MASAREIAEKCVSDTPMGAHFRAASRMIAYMKTPVIVINGDYLRALRDAHGYTPETFAEVVDTSPSNLRRIEQGKRQPAPDLRKRIAVRLGIPLVALRDKEPFEAALARALEAVAA